LREIIKLERQILLDLENKGYRYFPRVFPLLDDDSEIDYTVAYIISNDVSLRQVFSRHGKPLEKQSINPLVQSVLPLCEALSILHKKGRSHRQLDPDQLLLLKGRYAMLQNIGLAAWPLKKGEVAGLYRAPEQKKDCIYNDAPGPRTDIYQLGALLYCLITGRDLSPGSSPAMYNHAVSRQLDYAIVRAVAPRPGERWATIDEFAIKLRQTLL
jgi:serine/threonine protein kinase